MAEILKCSRFEERLDTRWRQRDGNPPNGASLSPYMQNSISSLIPEDDVQLSTDRWLDGGYICPRMR